MALNLALVITGDAASAKAALAEAKGGLDQVSAANEAVAVSSDQARDASGRFAAANDASAASARSAADALREQASAQNQTQAAAERFAGVRPGLNFDARQTRQNDLNSYGRALDDLRAKYNPLYAAERAHMENLDGIAAAARMGAISEAERASAVTRANAIYSNQNALMGSSAASTKLAAHEITNMSAQLADLGVQLASGQSPLMAIVQQGPQIGAIMGDRGLTGIITGVGQGLMSLVTPTTLILAALAGGGYAAAWAFEMIRGEVKSTDQVLSEHEAFIQRVGEAYPEAARKAKAYAAESAEVLQALGAAQVADQIAALQRELRGVAATYDSIVNPIARPEALLTFPDFAQFVDILVRIEEESTKARPNIAAIRHEIAQIANDTNQAEGVREVANELLNATEGARALSAVLPQTESAIDGIDGAAERAALRLRLLNETAMGFADALGRLQAGDQLALSPREQALKDYIDAAGKALDARDAQTARAAYDARIARIENAEAGAGVPIPTARPNDIQRLDDAAEATDRLGKQTETVLQRQRDRIALLDLETGAMGQSEDARRALIAALETEQEIRRLGIDVQGDEANAMRANSAEIVRLTQERAAAVQAAREAEKDWSENRSLVKSIFGDFAGLLREGELGWKAWADAALNALDRIISRFADMAIESLLDSFMPKPGGSGASGSGAAQTASSLLSRVLGGSGSSSKVARLQSPANDNSAGLMLDEVVVSGSASAVARRNAIASIESAGSGDYAALGPWTRGDRAYGRYQVMGNNIGPWSEAALGRRLTSSQFLANPSYQDAVFDHRFGSYVDRYGERGAAQAWFGGPGSVGRLGRTDVLGTSVGGYGDKYVAALGRSSETASQALEKMATGAGSAGEAAATASQGLTNFGGGLNSLANSLMSIGGGEGGGGWFSGLMKSFGGAGGATSFMKGISPLATSFIAAGGVGLFSEGGYTGDGPRDAAAGVVHGQEFVVRASATARHRPMLEAMNAGLAYPGLSGGASSGAGGGSGAQRNQIDVRVWVEDDGTLRAVASEAGAQAGADQADIRVQAFNERLPDRVAEIQQYPRRR
ncbi:MAG: hypothetical protein DI629_03420 [Mesorhizobium amorphae]|nr:MAG: hypothetical protein DI629_03420 [Mesorhizobium amorphae]